MGSKCERWEIPGKEASQLRTRKGAVGRLVFSADWGGV
jgi:hypothetical protein